MTKVTMKKVWHPMIIKLLHYSADSQQTVERLVWESLEPTCRSSSDMFQFCPNFSQEYPGYLLHTWCQKFNDHSMPYFLHCHLCHQIFNVIGKFESITQDTKYIEGVLNLF